MILLQDCLRFSVEIVAAEPMAAGAVRSGERRMRVGEYPMTGSGMERKCLCARHIHPTAEQGQFTIERDSKPHLRDARQKKIPETSGKSHRASRLSTLH